MTIVRYTRKQLITLIKNSVYFARLSRGHNFLKALEYRYLRGKRVYLTFLFPPEQAVNNDPAPKVPDALKMAALDKNVRLLTVDCFLLIVVNFFYVLLFYFRGL